MMKRAVVVLLLLGSTAWAAKPDARERDEAAIRAVGEAYLEAIRNADIDAQLAAWTEEGDLIDASGRSEPARQVIETRRGKPVPASFAERTIGERRLRFLSADVALEDGESRVTQPDGSQTISRHTAVWVRQKGGDWRLSAVRELRPDAPPHQAPLAALEPLIGQWIGTAGENSVQVSAEWGPNRSFIEREMSLVAADRVVVRGHQIIAWNPVKQKLTAWSVSSDGSIAEATLQLVDNVWVILTEGSTPDGLPTSSTNLLRFIDADRATFDVLGHRVGNEQKPNVHVELTRAPFAAP